MTKTVLKAILASLIIVGAVIVGLIIAPHVPGSGTQAAPSTVATMPAPGVGGGIEEDQWREEEASPEPTRVVGLKLSDISLKPAVTNKDCYSDGICSIEFEVRMKLPAGVERPGPGERYQVVYSISGVVGADIGSLSTEAGEYTIPVESGEVRKGHEKDIKITPVRVSPGFG